MFGHERLFCAFLSHPLYSLSSFCLIIHPVCSGLEITYQLKPHTVTLDLSHNPLFGPEGIDALFAGITSMMTVGREPPQSCSLRELQLVNCGLGSSGK